MNWEGWAWVVWLVAFGVLEGYALYRNRNTMTLTYFIEHHFQKWMLAGLLGWLAYHFLIAPPARG